MSRITRRILGLDPGLTHTGWGIIDATGSQLRYVADGRVSSTPDMLLPDRLVKIDKALSEVIKTYQPDAAAVEETYVNKNALSALKLGQARGVVLLVPARAGLYVAEYGANMVKKSVVGNGHADKDQVAMMVKMLLGVQGKFTAPDSSDALAVAICHAHHASSLLHYNLHKEAL